MPHLVFFFNTKITRNAYAGTYNDFYVISINIGTISWLLETFKNGVFDDTEKLPLFKILVRYLDDTVANIMYDSSLHFTFYHELAHLVQKADFISSFNNVEPQGDVGFSEDKHLLELDADEFSAFNIAAHIMQFYNKLFHHQPNKEFLEGIIILITSPIVLYVLAFNTTNRDVYYRENTHPHPVIRITYIILTICNYINGVLDNKNYGFSLNMREIINRLIIICKEIESTYLTTNSISNYNEQIVNNIFEVKEYLKSFHHMKENNTELAVYKWNLSVD